MKKYHSILIALLCLGFLSSCTDYLNVTPANVMSINTYTDIKALVAGHLKMYKEGVGDGFTPYLQGTSVFYYDNNDYLITHFYSDDYDPKQYLQNYIGRNNQGDFNNSLQWMHPRINEEIWGTLYSNIGFYNMVMAELAKHPSANTEDNERVAGEIRFLRAWQFFRLVQFYSPYHIDKLGLPLNTDPDAVGDYDRSRKTQTENYKFIISELEDVLNYKAEPDSKYNIFYDKRIVCALLAEVYLYKGDSGAKAEGDYAKAADYAHRAMDGRLSLKNVYPVPDAHDDFGLFKDKDYALITCIYSNYSSHIANVTGDYKYGLTQYASDALFNLFPKNDKRKDYFFTDKKVIKKKSSDFPFYFAYWNFFTAAEMQLIIAESYARMGDEAKAEAALKVFTDSRYDNFVKPEGKTTLDCVLIERRKEFCYDYCMRWLDLTRLQKGWTRPALDNVKDKKATYTLEDGDYRFCFPIPKKNELQYNKIEQNPGWNNF